MLKQPEVEAF